MPDKPNVVQVVSAHNTATVVLNTSALPIA